jgi:putative OPT family oligopeptide transporter
VGAFFKFLTSWLRLFPDEIHARIPFLKKSQLGFELSAALFGVGYILGPRIGAIMVGGGLLSWLVLIPVLAFWGESRTTPLYPEVSQLISEMNPDLLWTRYVRYIGAGAVAAAGLLTLIRSIPTMLKSFQLGAQQFRASLQEGFSPVRRTDQDLPLRQVLLFVATLILLMAAIPQGFSHLDSPLSRIVASLLVTIFAFFFVTVSSRIVGLVGVTSNPTSGMTIATLLGTTSVFLFLGWTDVTGKAAAVTVGCVVAIAASIAGDTSQDLKTGFILGATPRRQQIGELLGVLTSAVFVCLAVLLLDKAYGFGSGELPAPQATLMKLVVEGVLDSTLPWALIGIGVLIALFVELLRLPSLPFAVGVYLPITTTATVALGGLLRWLLERQSEQPALRRERGILFGSGLVGGEGLLGVAIAAVAFVQGTAPSGLGYEWAGPASPFIALVAFTLLTLYFVRRSKSG